MRARRIELGLAVALVVVMLGGGGPSAGEDSAEMLPVDDYGEGEGDSFVEVHENPFRRLFGRPPVPLDFPESLNLGFSDSRSAAPASAPAGTSPPPPPASASASGGNISPAMWDALVQDLYEMREQRMVARAEAAARAGDPQPLYDLGKAYAGGHFGPPQPRAAMRWFVAAGKLGFGPAQYEVGLMYQMGVGSTTDTSMTAVAVDWFKQAANNGVEQAQLTLAVLYGSGFPGQHADPHQEVEWLQMAADQGSLQAMSRLAVKLYQGVGNDEPDYALACYLFHACSEGGMPLCTYNYGLCYEFGVGGHPLDMEEAFAWFRLAATQGNIRARARLGTAFLDGYDVLDEATIITYITEAAQANDNEGITNLGVCYERGLGSFEQDLEKAFLLYSKAADKGHARAQYLAGTCYQDGVGTKKDVIEATRFFSLAAQNSYAPAMYALGLCYKTGQGSEADPEQALIWFELASEFGSQQATALLETETYVDKEGILRFLDSAESDTDKDNDE